MYPIEFSARSRHDLINMVRKHENVISCHTGFPPLVFQLAAMGWH